MENLNAKMIQKTDRPIKEIQFGEGNFVASIYYISRERMLFSAKHPFLNK